MGVALPSPFGWSGMLEKFSKIFWSTAYSMQKGLWKNIHPSPFNNSLNEMGVALPCPFRWSGMLDKIFKNILDHSLLDAKKIMKKYSSVLL